MLSENKTNNVLSRVTRRSFMKGAAALGATAALYGCGSDDGESYNFGGNLGVDAPDLNTEDYFYGTGGHNCASKCVSKAWVKNGRIIRITSAEQKEEYKNGYYQDPDSQNNTQSRACAKCRTYKFRLYHPGRLKYPLKQTIERGRLDGFVRISWEQALDEIARKHKAIIDNYGPEAIHSMYACGNYSSDFQGGGAIGPWNARGGESYLFNSIGGASSYYSNYSFHQQGTFGANFTGWSALGGRANANDVANSVKSAVLWGSNHLSTRNHVSNSTIQSFRKMKDRGGKVWFVGPYLSDQGVNTASEWIQMRPYTDAALVMGMLHEMIVNTFDANGNILNNASLKQPYLKVDYLDMMAHGFFDSPGYWLDKSAGEIIVDAKENDPGSPFVWINEVPAGKSLSAYIMGSDDRLTLATYDDPDVANYTATKFGARKRNMSTCSYVGNASSKYQRKLDYLTPKTPEWAEAITGVPREKIRELAAFYCNEANHPLYSEYCGGQQKQAEGVNNMFAVQALLIVTQTYGRAGEVYERHHTGVASVGTAENLPGIPQVRVPLAVGNYVNKTPVASCTMWHNSVKFAFWDDLKANGYRSEYVPDCDINAMSQGKVYHDDGGSKSLVKVKRNPTTGAVLVDGDGYYEYETDGQGKPIYSGYRLIYNMGGNIPVNQHQNANDNADLFKCLTLGSKDPDNADTFCMISYDNFLSASPRYSDYVLPGTTVWEMENQLSGIDLGNRLVTPVVTKAPGESWDNFKICVEFLRAYERIDSTAKANNVALNWIGADVNIGDPIDANDSYGKKLERAYEESELKTNASSKYYGLTYEEALKVQYQNKTPGADTTSAFTSNAVRDAMDTYLALDPTTRRTNQLVLPITDNNTGGTGYGKVYSTATAAKEPVRPNKAILYSELFVWQYENRFEKWHKYLDPADRGQKNIDPEGDPIIYPIPMYFPYEDYFMEAYGGKEVLAAMPNQFLLTTTHDRYRSHSTMAESPYLRELTHRLKGRDANGKPMSGNDWGTYAISDIQEDGTIARVNKSIADKDASRASWSEIFMNSQDAKEFAGGEIKDGDLLEVGNAIGAVRVIAHLTDRCVRGYLDLHQGCWYDPDPDDGVDDGGCANTLMATKPSRYDHGNGQQSAMVYVKKVNLGW